MIEPIRIANCSGFLGDRMEAAKEMVVGGPIDVLTGDYLAELTMAILARQRMRDPDAGYARQFLSQLEGVLGECVARGIKVVANAGGLNPAALAAAVRDLAERLGVAVAVAHVTGDDVLDRLGDGRPWAHARSGMTLAQRRLQPVTANAYLGGWGIADALGSGADIVVTGRVSDASLVAGPAAWYHGWDREDWDALAGAVVAGHVIECGAQATGGNYSFFEEIDGLDHPGFPIAEVERDGSSIITKHPGTGGEVSIGTVTAQLLYEIDAPAYRNPDVTVDLGSIRLSEPARDRVAIQGVRGGPPPRSTKVGVVGIEGFRNSVTFVIPGLDVEAKAALAEDALWRTVGDPDTFARVERTLVASGSVDPAVNESAFSSLTVTVVDPDPARVGRAFSNAAVELALASYPGFTLTAPPGAESPAIVFWPTAVDQREVPAVVTLGAQTWEVPATRGEDDWGAVATDAGTATPTIDTVAVPMGDTVAVPMGDTVAVPIGRLLGARSGDKGGDANLGVWARSEDAFAWLASHLDVERLRRLLPEAADNEVERHLLPNLRAVNFVLRGFLGEGVASNSKADPQAKTLAEYFRARVVEIPESLLTV